MTLPEVYELIAALPNGGFLSDESRLDRPFIYQKIHEGRATAIQNWYLRHKNIHNSWYFPLNLSLDKSQQIDGCYYHFELPQIIAMDSRHSGMGYIGTIKFNQGFRVTLGRAKFASQQADRFMKVRDTVTDVLVENDFLEIYGKMPQKFRVEAIWSDPTKLSSYNIEKDQYPIDFNLIGGIQSYILQRDVVLITRTKSDTIQNKKDDSVTVGR